MPPNLAHEEVLDRLDALAPRAMAHWNVPGLALAVLLPGREPFVKAYGVRDTLTGAPVTTRTQFHACSVTKSFTAAGLLLLLRERKLELTTRVRELLPDFQLSDPVASAQVSLRDFLCHASGLPRHDRIWTPGDLTRGEMVRRMRHLALSCGLRERYQYNNLGYVVLAEVAERLSGQRWEDYTRQVLLQPLGWRDFGFTPQDLLGAEDHAHPHPRQGVAVYRGKVWPAATPAGGLNASIEDMVRWAQFLLGAPLPGVAGERSHSVLADMTTPWMYGGRSIHPEFGHWHYGLGLACEGYRGLGTVSHAGAMPGWGSLLSVLPDSGAAIVVLTNRDPSPVPQLLTFTLFDWATGLEPVDWYGRFAALREKSLREEAARQEQEANAPEPALATEPERYVGRYAEAAYGELHVTLADGRLRWAWRGFGGPMKARGAHVFLLEETPPPRHGEPRFVATFALEAQGPAASVSVPMEAEVPQIVFTRV